MPHPFPKPDDAHFEQPDVATHQVRKLGRTQESYFRGVDPQIRRVLSEFNEMPFLDFLEGLTGIAGLIPDPHFRGGAFHQILTGGKLDMHADFNVDRRRRLLRRINVLIYLNRPWPPDYRGELCLRRDGADPSSVRVLPIFNRCVIFNTDSTSFPRPPRTAVRAAGRDPQVHRALLLHERPGSIRPRRCPFDNLGANGFR